ncbi:MAG: hypothetical protein Q7J54_07090 [Candidatus Woesearchaeota archaeon]|nr:hypothetical protein [Candidatus Woesearchaeota archaeon]
MDANEINDKRIMHIDTSSKLYERKKTGIAYKIIGSNLHKGAGLSLKLKKELERDLGVGKDYGKLYALYIYCLIKDDLDLFDVLVICGDEDFTRVKKYLNLLFQKNDVYSRKEIISLYELRELTGKKKLKSYADNIANSYRKRALRSATRQQEGIPLNPIKITYKMICEKWKELE